MMTEQEVRDLKISLEIKRSAAPYSDEGMDYALQIKILRQVLQEDTTKTEKGV